MINIGFSAIDLSEALRPHLPVREERVQAIAMYISSSHCESVWVELDFMDFNLAVINSLTCGINSALGIDSRHIHILTTHNHGGGEPDLSELTRLVAQCVVKAKENSAPALMKMAFGNCDRNLTIKRRKYVPELQGVTTLFFGATEKEGFDSAPFIENAVKNIRQGVLSYRGRDDDTTRPPSPFDAGDNLIAAVEFCSLEGKTLGTIVRFSSHAVCCNREGSFSSDFPYHTRKAIEEHLGGICMFMNGPCAEIAPAISDKCEGGEKRIGLYIAQCALELLKNAQSEEITGFRDDCAVIPLPVREEVMKNLISIPPEMPEDLPERRRHLEMVRFSDTLPFLRGKYAEGESDLKETVSISFGMLRLNDFMIAAFPGETFSSTAKKFCENLQLPTLCTVTEHGRTVMYLPEKEDIPHGGYETVCRLTDNGAAEILLKKATEAFKEFLS